jgi:hypothetical protein
MTDSSESVVGFNERSDKMMKLMATKNERNSS